MRFVYTAVSANNKKSQGVINAADKNDAKEQLLSKGLTALQLTEEETAGKNQSGKFSMNMDLGNSDIHAVKIPKKKLLSLLNQLAIMMKSGITLSLAMNVLIDGEKDKKVKQILQEINKDLFSGVPLSRAMKKFKAFPELVTSMVQSGEENGRLDTAFERCAVITEKELNVTSKLHSAMIYPIIMLFLIVGLLIIMNTLVLPSFIGIFKEFHSDLPAITVMVMNVSDFFTTKWYILIGVIAAIVIAYKLAKKNSEAFAYNVDVFKLHFPLIGKTLRLSLTSRFCQVTSSLMEAGVDIVRSLEISRDVITNLYMRNMINAIIEDVKIGVSIHDAMSKYPIFDSILVSMVRVGEESGMLTDSMDKMASLYEQQSDESTKRLLSLTEPIMIIIIALIVGTVIISIVTPMFGMYSIIK